MVKTHIHAHLFFSSHISPFFLFTKNVLEREFLSLFFYDEYTAERAHTQFQPSQESRQGVLALGIICVRALIESWQAEDCPLKRCIHPPQKGDNSERKWDAGNPRGNLGLGFWNKTQ